MVSRQPMSDCQWACVGPVFAVCSATVELDRSPLAAFQPIKYVVSASETFCNKSHWLVVLCELYDMWICYICEWHGCLEWRKWRWSDQHDFLKTVSNDIYRLLPPAGMEGYFLSYKHRMYMLVWPLAVVFVGCSSSSIFPPVEWGEYSFFLSSDLTIKQTLGQFLSKRAHVKKKERQTANSLLTLNIYCKEFELFANYICIILL